MCLYKYDPVKIPNVYFSSKLAHTKVLIWVDDDHVADLQPAHLTDSRGTRHPWIVPKRLSCYFNVKNL